MSEYVLALASIRALRIWMDVLFEGQGTLDTNIGLCTIHASSSIMLLTQTEEVICFVKRTPWYARPDNPLHNGVEVGESSSCPFRSDQQSG